MVIGCGSWLEQQDGNSECYDWHQYFPLKFIEQRLIGSCQSSGNGIELIDNTDGLDSVVLMVLAVLMYVLIYWTICEGVPL